MATNNTMRLAAWGLVALGNLFASAVIPAQDVSFFARRDFFTHTLPNSIAVGDFNGDGIPDLAVTNWYTSDVSMLFGTGDGNFQPARNFPVGNQPTFVAAGDFNGDSILDLAIGYEATLGGPRISVMLGNGDGTFQSPVVFESYQLVESVAVGDLNGDGVSDLVVASSDVVSVMLGTSDARLFGARRDFHVGNGCVSLAIGDFNGDGRPDVAVAKWQSTSVSVLLGNGDGTFQSPRDFGAGVTPRSVAIGDFNGDGVLDLAVANGGGGPPGAGSVSVLIGNGDGTFRPPRDYGVGIRAQSVIVGDFNRDGVPDLAVIHEGYGTLPGSVSVLLGTGDGDFQVTRKFEVGNAPNSGALSDFNGDGTPDLAVVNHEDGTISVLLGNGDGSFQAAPNFGGRGRMSSPTAIAVEDFNGDGVKDLAVANASSNTVSVLLGNGDGMFQTARNFGTGGGPSSVAVGDFNNDGLPDLVVGNDSSRDVSVLLGNGDGSFQNARSFVAGPAPSSVAVGDFNGDGLADVAVADFGGRAWVLLGNGDGSFQEARGYIAGDRPTAVSVGDFNADGVPDLAVANSVGADVSILLGNGDGTFQDARNYPAGSGLASVAVGDFDGDGIPDLAVAHVSADALVSVLRGNGDGTFGRAESFGLGGSTAVVVGDFNRDGIPDLALTVGGGDLVVLLGNGDGRFGLPHYFGANAWPRSLAVGDFNGDGAPDLAVANYRSDDVSVLINNTPLTSP